MKKNFFLRLFFISVVAFSLIWGGYIYKTIFNVPLEEEETYRENFIDRMVDDKEDITFFIIRNRCKGCNEK